MQDLIYPNSSTRNTLHLHEEPVLGELMHGVFRNLRRGWTESLAPFDLTPHQWRTLSMVSRHDDGCPRLRDVADSLRITPRSATDVVDQLEAKGLITRSPDPTDRRAILLALTAEGNELINKVSSVRRDQSEEFFQVLSADEREQLSSILRKLSAS
ncbi:MarR family winged helix-turn-helix transcriptional regulator [Neomicrococcus lactis]|uniref:DNA-binding MarR family transcriptional regulator n=1 Tax=Neomicrococcus lactis TaxID=732241 RepID=A0A7W8YCV3_9MICC|nr:DNA-binding MarR family transcriptional regulator [Neomicrococcus lactis]